MRGLKSDGPTDRIVMVRRIAHAVRGLKFGGRFHFVPMFRSHRSRGAGIEISLGEVELYPPPGRIAHAVRGLKYRKVLLPF